MKTRRVGCLIFGIVWALVFAVTNFGLALGDFADPEQWANRVNPLSVLFWIEIVVFVVGALLFYRLEMKDGEF